MPRPHQQVKQLRSAYRQHAVAALRVRVNAVRGAGIERAVDQHLQGAHAQEAPAATHRQACPQPFSHGPVQILRIDPSFDPERIKTAGDPSQPLIAVPGHLEVHDAHDAPRGSGLPGIQHPRIHHACPEACPVPGSGQTPVPRGAVHCGLPPHRSGAAAEFSQTQWRSWLIRAVGGPSRRASRRSRPEDPARRHPGNRPRPMSVQHRAPAARRRLWHPGARHTVGRAAGLGPDDVGPDGGGRLAS